MDSLIAIDKALYFIQKARVSCQVRETHLEKRELRDELTSQARNKIEELEEWLNDRVREIVSIHPAYGWFSKVKGIGDLNIGKVVCLIEIEKCPTISKLWRYALGAPINGKVEKRTKGEKIHYNAMLKVMCWRLAKSLIRANGTYAEYYHNQKNKIVIKKEADGIKIVPSNQLPKKDGKHIETDEYYALGHIDMTAIRKMTKLFLSHLWLVWRENLKLPVTQPYIHAIGGHDGYIGPWEMVEKAKIGEKSIIKERANSKE